MVNDKVKKVHFTSTLVDPTSSSWARPILTNGRLAVEVFDGTGHFGMWQSEVLDALFQQGPDISVEESKPEDVEERNWLSINQLACALEEKFLKKNSQNKLFMKKQLFRFTYVSGSSINMLRSLPEEYKLLETTLLNGKDDVSRSEVCASLYSKELRRKDKKISSSGDAKVLLVRGKAVAEANVTKCDDEESDLSLATSSSRNDSEIWLLDFACSHHITPHREWFSNFEEHEEVVYTTDETPLTTHGIGSVRLQNEDETIVTLKGIRYSPKLKKNLISVGTLESKRLEVREKDEVIKIISGVLVVMKGEKSLNFLIKQGLLKGLSSCKLDLYEHCINRKMTRMKFRTPIHKTQELPKKAGFERIIVPADREPDDNSPMVEGDYEEEEVQTEEPQQQQHESITTSKPKRNTKRPARLNDTVACASSITTNDVLTTYSEAELNNLLEGKKAIGCKWVYAKKEGFHGQDDVRYKARLVGKGYAHKEGIDYNEVFSPVVKHSSIRILLALVAQLDLEQFQMDMKTAFLHDDAERAYIEKVPYANAVGSLMYPMICTRPDISHAVGMVSRYMHNPGKGHWQDVKWILWYIHHTVDVGLVFEHGSSQWVAGYCDSDYARDLDKRRSTTGYVFTLEKAPISWKSTLQSTTTLSTMKVEYMAMTEAVKEAIWLQGLLSKLGIKPKFVTMHSDSQSAIHITKNQVYHARTKHIDVRYHFIREILEEGGVRIQKIHTSKNHADMVTKVVAGIKFNYCLDLINIVKS
nr:retrovirus-related Pol polyprotein from transposon TNT 1-94 [Tanacetum cinerariifolium]